MKKLSTQLATISMVLFLALAAPTAALADGHQREDGPMPVAIVGTVIGGALWLVSTPFTALFAPTQIMESFDTMVAAPWRTTIGTRK